MVGGPAASSATRRRKLSASSQVGAWFILALATFAALELSSRGALFLAEKAKNITYSPISVSSLSESERNVLEDLLAGKTDYTTYSSTLGWTIKPNGQRLLPPYRANSKGIRANREYTLSPPENVLRIATFGDSFTHGDDVRNEDTWQEVMMRAHRNLEVLNFGVGGFGLDQAFLRYQQDGATYKPHIVLIGFFTDNIYRNVNVFRPFYAPRSFPLAKPRYILEGDRLVLLQNPMRDLSQYRDLLTNPARVLPELGTHDYFFHSGYREGHFDFLPSVRLFRVARYHLLQRSAGIVTRNGYYNVDSEAFKVTVAIFDQFVDTVLHAGAVPVIVVMPDGNEVERYRRNGTKAYAPLLAYFRTKGYGYVDILDGFAKYAREMNVRELAPSHYSPSGYRLVAEFIWQYLAEHRLVDPKTLGSQ